MQDDVRRESERGSTRASFTLSLVEPKKIKKYEDRPEPPPETAKKVPAGYEVNLAWDNKQIGHLQASGDLLSLELEERARLKRQFSEKTIEKAKTEQLLNPEKSDLIAESSEPE